MHIDVTDGKDVITVGPAPTFRELLEFHWGKLIPFVSDSESQTLTLMLVDGHTQLLCVHITKHVPIEELLSRIGIVIPGMVPPNDKL